jgi:hypothetical protein
LIETVGTTGERKSFFLRATLRKGAVMMIFLIIGSIVGILLGLRFKVFVLVPAILIAAGAIVVVGHGLKLIVLTVLATSALLQIGYVVGCVVRVYASAYLRHRTTLRHHRLDLSR